MDFYSRAPYWTLGLQCQVCDREIEPADRVYADAESATDTGDFRTVEHVGCHVSAQRRVAQALTQSAKRLRQNLDDPEGVATGLELDSQRIARQLTKHNEARH